MFTPFNNLLHFELTALVSIIEMDLGVVLLPLPCDVSRITERQTEPGTSCPILLYHRLQDGKLEPLPIVRVFLFTISYLHV